MPMSGKEMLKLYLKNGWVVLRQKGSHITVAKGTLRTTIPAHKELKRGTEHGLLKKLAEG
jgi:predicted RNA binding protein YcfA (HicA-like mRNA interferase family)